MSIKTRRFLFYSLVIVFIILGTFLVSNSRGYRLNWESFQVEATGGIYISSTPLKSQIKLDGEDVKNEAGILQRGTLIDNLLPGEYVLNVELDGYSPWKKKVDVESGTVAVFDYIVLVPQTEPLQLSESLARKIVASGNHIAIEAGGGVSLNGTLVFGHEIVSLTDNGTLLTRSTITDNYYLANALKLDENLNLTLTFNNLKGERLNLPGPVDIKKALPYPYNDRRFIIATNQALYLLDVDKLTIEQVALGPNNFFIQGQNSIAWIEDQEVKMFNLPLKSETVALDLDALGIQGGSLKELRYTPIGWLALKADGELMVLRQDAEPETIATSVKSFILAPSEESVALVRDNNTLSVYRFEDQEEVAIDSSELLKDFVWFKDSIHIILLKGETLVFTEVGGAGPGNAIVLGEGVRSFSYPGGETVSFSDQLGVWEKTIID